MRASLPRIYVHFVWSTWDRLPMLDESIRGQVYAAVADKCREMRCVPLAIGGTDNHIHVLAHLHATVPVSELVQQMKGASSHLVTHRLAPGAGFKWQGSYGAFSVSPDGLEALEAYIKNQEVHHRDGSAWAEMERTGVD
jgi:putative transposase